MSTKAFEVIRGTVVMAAASATVTITEGVDYNLPSGADANSCFIRIANTRKTGMWRTSGGWATSAFNFTTIIQDPGNIATSITFERHGTSGDNRIDYEIVCYVGASGGDNEIIVRAVGTVNGSTAQLTGGTITTIDDDADCVVFITGQKNDSNTQWEYALFVASLVANGGDWDPQFDREIASAGAGEVSYAVVEFKGSNWTVTREEFTDEGSTWSTGNSNSFNVTLGTSVAAVAKTFLHVQYTCDARATILEKDAGDAVGLVSTTQLKVYMRSTGGVRRRVAWLVQNSQAHATARNLTVEHLDWADDTNSGSEERSFTQSVTTVDALDETSVELTCSIFHGVTGYPAGSINYRLTDASTLTLTECDVTSPRRFLGCVFQWPEDPILVSDDGTFKYDVAELLAENGTFKYDVRNLVLDQLISWYDVLAPAPAKGLKDLENLPGGPWIMWTTDSSVRIWFYVPVPTDVPEIRLFPTGQSFFETPGRNFIEVTGLKPATVYEYQYFVNGSPEAPVSEFVTMPTEGQPGKFIVVYMSDHHMSYPAALGPLDERYGYILEYLRPFAGVPKLCILNGDHEIPGSHDSGSDDLLTRKDNMTQLRNVGRQGSNRYDFHRSIPTYWTWDDWDYLGNNSAGADEFIMARFAARSAMRQFWDGLPEWTDPDTINYSMVVANCFFMFLDARTKRTQTLGTKSTSGQADPLTWDPLTAVAYGPAQIQWIKDQLAANSSAFLKFMINGDNWLDHMNGAASGPAARDSVGMFHRNERNEILAWLRDNPAAAVGAMLLKGDDHVSTLHRVTNWKQPENFKALVDGQPNTRAEPDPDTPIGPRSPLIHFAGALSGGPGAAQGAWHGHPDEILYQGPSSKDVWIVHVDTTGGEPEAEFVLLSVDPPSVVPTAFQGTSWRRPIYRFWFRDGTFHLPRSGYSLRFDENFQHEHHGYRWTEYDPATEPSSSWAKKDENP